MVGAPLAALLLSLDGTLGLRGWQWLFLMEGLPTIIFGFILKASSPTPDETELHNPTTVAHLNANAHAERAL